MPFVPIVSIGNTYRDPHSSQVSGNRDGDINASTDMLSRSREYRLSNVSFECDVPASIGIYIARLSQRWNSGSEVWNGDYADCFGLVKRWDTAKILSIRFGVYKDTWLGKGRGPSVFDSSHKPAGLVNCNPCSLGEFKLSRRDIRCFLIRAPNQDSYSEVEEQNSGADYSATTATVSRLSFFSFLAFSSMDSVGGMHTTDNGLSDGDCSCVASEELLR